MLENLNRKGSKVVLPRCSTLADNVHPANEQWRRAALPGRSNLRLSQSLTRNGTAKVRFASFLDSLYNKVKALRHFVVSVLRKGHLAVFNT
jgi:hypothetical protein